MEPDAQDLHKQEDHRDRDGEFGRQSLMTPERAEPCKHVGIVVSCVVRGGTGSAGDAALGVSFTEAVG